MRAPRDGDTPAEASRIGSITTPLQVGFVVDPDPIPRWQAQLIEEVAAESGLVATSILRGPASNPPPRHPVLAAYDRADALLDRGHNRWLDPTPLPAQIAAATATSSAPPRDLDVVLILARDPRLPDVTAPARYGRWGIEYAGADPRDDASAALEGMIDLRALVEARVISTDAEERRSMIGRVVTLAHPHSLVRTRSVLAAALLNLILGRLRALRDLGESACADWERDAVGPTAPSTARGAIAITAFAMRSGFRVLGRLWDGVWTDEYHWSVAIAPRPDGALAREPLELAPRWLENPVEEYFADPFLIEHESRSFLFVERFSYRTGRGSIAVLRLGPQGEIQPPETVLDRPYHLSYPCIVRSSDTFFMVPESGEHERIELYTCKRFPDRWELEAVLLDGVRFADATLFTHGDRWWMFVCLASRGLSADTELHLYHADDIRGPWRPHPLNPVVSDVRCARPAGMPWIESGELIRPAQKCAPRYGSAVSFQRITRLTPVEYAEERIATLTPEDVPGLRGARGVHTWNLGAGCVVFDAARARSRWVRWLDSRRSARAGTRDAQGSG